MERILILIAEFGTACVVVYTGFGYFFKNSFRELIEPLKDALDRLSYNVNQQTETQNKQMNKLDNLEHLVGENSKDIIKHEEQIKTLFSKER